MQYLDTKLGETPNGYIYSSRLRIHTFITLIMYYHMSFHYKSIDTLQQYNDMKRLLFFQSMY